MSKTATWRNTPFAHRFYHSRQWDDVRRFVLDRAHGLCEECASRGGVSPADVVHHLIPLTPENMEDPAIALNPDNLKALCHDCHTEAHRRLGVGVLGSRRAEEPRVGFDSEGNVVELPPKNPREPRA